DEGHPLGRAFSTGGFHNAMVYPALNALAAAWADLTLLAQRHVAAFHTAVPPAQGQAAPAQASGSAAGSGTGLEPLLSSLVAEARAAAMPTLLPAAGNDSQGDASAPHFRPY